MNWLIPCNIKYYDIVGAFSEFTTIDWRQTVHIEEGDTVYIYCGLPIQKILYKTKTIKVNIPFTKINYDDRNFYLHTTFKSDAKQRDYMRLLLLKSYNTSMLSLECLFENGLKSAPQGPLRLNQQMITYLEKY